jgi:hypothetical protein
MKKDKNKKKALILIPYGILAILSFFFFSFKNVNGATAFQQTINATSTATAPYSGGTGRQTLGQPTINTTLDTIILRGKNPGTGSNIDRITITVCSTPISPTNPSFGGCTGTLIGQETSNNHTWTNSMSGYDFQTYTFTATTTDTTRYYSIELTSVSNCLTCTFEGSSVNAYPNGEYTVFYTGTYHSDASIQDLYFQIGAGLTAGTGDDNFIEFLYPNDLSTQPDFGNWVTEYQIAATTTPLINFALTIYTGNSSFGPLLDGLVTPRFYARSPQPIQRQNPFPNGSYFAQARIYAIPNDGTIDAPSRAYILATSTTINFTIDSTSTSTSGGWTDPTTGDIPPGINGNCSGNIFNVDDWICNLFFTSTTSTSYFREQITGIKSAFPFNIFFALKDATSNALQSRVGETGQTLSIHLPTGANVNVLTPTMLEDNVGSTTKAKIFELQKNIMWIGAGLLMLFKII